MPDRCYWTRSGDGDEVLIPVCWAAVHNPLDCTCDVPGSRLDYAERGRAIAEAEVTRLREKLHRAQDRIAELLRRNRALWAEGNRLRGPMVATGMPEREADDA